MSEREFGEIHAKLDGVLDAFQLLALKQSILSEDVAALKVTVPRNVAISDQKDKGIIKFIVWIAKWMGVPVAILFGSHGVEDIFK